MNVPLRPNPLGPPEAPMSSTDNTTTPSTNQARTATVAIMPPSSSNPRTWLRTRCRRRVHISSASGPIRSPPVWWGRDRPARMGRDGVWSVIEEGRRWFSRGASPGRPISNPPPAQSNSSRTSRGAEGLPRGGDYQPSAGRPNWKLLAAVVIGGYLLSFLLFSVQDRIDAPRPVAYTEFTAQVQMGNVAEVFTRGDTIQGRLREPKPVPDQEDATYVNSVPWVASALWAGRRPNRSSPTRSG
jgi:hypothetical protein